MAVKSSWRMRADFVPLAHVVGNDKEHGGQRGERNVAGQRRGDQKNGEQRERVDDAGDRRARAGADVGGGAGDGAGGGNSAEERRGDVGDSLRDKFDVGIVAVAGHAVGDDGGEHAFKRGKQRNRECRWDQRQDVLGVESREWRRAEGRGEFRRSGCRWFRPADETDAETTVQTSSATMDAGMRLVNRGRMSMMASVADAERERLPVEAWRNVADQQLHARQEFAGNGADAEAEEVLDLRRCDENGDAVGESDDDRYAG